MADRKVLHVSPGRQSWDVTAEDAGNAIEHYRTRDQALKRAKDIAKVFEEGEVILHRRDGTVEADLHYSRNGRARLH